MQEKKRNPVQKIGLYFKEVIAESKKISWPSRKETTKLTIIVLSIGTIVSLIITVFDFIFKSGLTSYLKG